MVPIRATDEALSVCGVSGEVHQNVKRTVEIIVYPKPRKQKLEVELPMYRKRDALVDQADIVTYTRVDETCTAFSIKRCDRYDDPEGSIEYVLATEVDYEFPSPESDHGERATSAEEFSRLCDEVEVWLRKARPESKP